MLNTVTSTNATLLNRELDWFSELLETRMKLYFGQESGYASIWDVKPPHFMDGDDAFFAKFLKFYQLRFEERVVLVLSLVPHIKPQLLDIFWEKNTTYERGFTEFGGLKGNSHGGFLPTIETALFLLAGDNLEHRFSLMYMFEADHFFEKHNILKLRPPAEGEPVLSSGLSLSREFVDYFTTGTQRKPSFSADFPARLMHTLQEWEDLVLPNHVFNQIEEIKTWITHGNILMTEWELNKKIKPGFRSLFYGPPGTGKSLTACLLGKYCKRDVYRVDLSQVVSKYIGETEKNLSKIFDMAEHKEWILFFDEADALFGKRSNTSDAHDRYANQEVSYLLQRIEDFNGIILLASNLKSNIDDAFARRFQSIIHFPLPQPDERLKIWEKTFSSKTILEERIDLSLIAHRYELSGGLITNIVRYCSLMALKRNENIIRLPDLEEGIRKELRKEGKTL